MNVIILLTVINAAAIRFDVSYEAVETLHMEARYLSPSQIAHDMQGAMTLDHALSKVKTIPENVKLAITQSKAKRAAGFLKTESFKEMSRESLDKAKDSLNKMMDQVQAELDAAVEECHMFDIHTLGELNTNCAVRAQLSSESASADGEISVAEGVIVEAGNEIENLRAQEEDFKSTCDSKVASATEALAILEHDLQISVQVEGMTECAPEKDALLLQCGPRLTFAGRAASLSMLKSGTGHSAMQRAAKIALGREAGKGQYSFLAKKHKRRKHKQQKQKAQTHASQEPPSKEDAASAEDLAIIGNLSAAAAMPEPPSFGEPMSKCTVSGSSSCPVIRDALAQLSSEVRFARDQAKAELNKHEESCKTALAFYKADAAGWKKSLNTNNAELAESTGAKNTAEQELELKVQVADDLTTELTSKRNDCRDKIQEGAETLCGITTIRTELYQMNGIKETIQDCVVGEWEPQECSHTCGGGERVVLRRVLIAANGGAACPILQLREACNNQRCPIDCIMGDWSGFESCSKQCGGGMQSRSRIPRQKPEFGGEACVPGKETVDCNIGQCDLPCELGFWTEWGSCSKVCNSGLASRSREVIKEAGPNGECPAAEDEERMEQMTCNEQACPPDLACEEKLDVIVLIDGSGSVTPGSSWSNEVQFTKSLFSQLEFGEDLVQAGVVLFSDKAYLFPRGGAATSEEADDNTGWMTFSREELVQGVDSMSLPGASHDTAGALGRAQNALQNGRTDARSVVFMVTDGNPNDMTAMDEAAASVKKTSRLLVVTVGGNVNEEAAQGWASEPYQENVMNVPDFSSLQPRIVDFVASMCTNLVCSENMTGNGQDYIGCQSTTTSGEACQRWDAQTPNSHQFLASKPEFANAHLGAHNYCRNPDNSEEGIWCFTSTGKDRWSSCEPRAVNTIPEFYSPDGAPQ